MVTGDLNAVPESDEVRLLEGFLTEPAVPDLLLVDAWRYADPADRGITWSRANPHAAKTGEPDARIDYVLVGTPRGAGSALITGARVAGDRPRDGVWPSDHAAVVVDLRLGEPRSARAGGCLTGSAVEVGGVAEFEDRGAAGLADGESRARTRRGTATA